MSTFANAFHALPALALAAGASVPADAATSPAMLPNRLLTCHLGHATNLDPTKDQRADEITFDSYHDLVLFLPAIPMRTSPPPDATDPAEPVHPATRVLSDPDGIAANVTGPFVRVIDTWPQRVEMIKPMAGGLSKLFIVSDIDEANRRAHLFLTDAADLVTLDLKRAYLGDCTVSDKASVHRSTRVSRR